MKVKFERMQTGQLVLCLVSENDSDALALNEFIAGHPGNQGIPQEGFTPASRRPGQVLGRTTFEAQMQFKDHPEDRVLGVDRLWVAPAAPLIPPPPPQQNFSRRPPMTTNVPQPLVDNVGVGEAPPG